MIVIAGSSAGRDDYTAQVIDKIGRLAVHGVAVRPGHPVVLGVVDGTPVIGAPGYPVSAALTFDIFGAPLLASPRGHCTEAADHRPRPDWPASSRRPGGSDDWVRVRLGRGRRAGGRDAAAARRRRPDLAGAGRRAARGPRQPGGPPRRRRRRGGAAARPRRGGPGRSWRSAGTTWRSTWPPPSCAASTRAQPVVVERRLPRRFAPLRDGSPPRRLAPDGPAVRRVHCAVSPPVCRAGLAVTPRVPGSGTIVRPETLAASAASRTGPRRVRYVNRQRGAGTRVLLDYRAREAGAAPER